MTVRRSTRGGRPASTLLSAFVLFVMLCGLALVVARGRDSATEPPEKEEPSGAWKAVHAIDRASSALEAQNYGQVRAHLNQARAALHELLSGRQEQ